MRGPREVLNELKWREDALAEAEVWYVHRGAPGDARVVPGGAVADLQRSFLVLREDGRETMIPYHRVFRIARGGRSVWERRGHARRPEAAAPEPGIGRGPAEGGGPQDDATTR